MALSLRHCLELGFLAVYLSLGILAGILALLWGPCLWHAQQWEMFNCLNYYNYNYCLQVSIYLLLHSSEGYGAHTFLLLDKQVKAERRWVCGACGIVTLQGIRKAVCAYFRRDDDCCTAACYGFSLSISLTWKISITALLYCFLFWNHLRF